MDYMICDQKKYYRFFYQTWRTYFVYKHPSEVFSSSFYASILYIITKKRANSVGLYFPIKRKNEIDIVKLFQTMIEKNLLPHNKYTFSLPVVEHKHLKHMFFAHYTFGDFLISGPFGTRHPATAVTYTQEVIPDIVFVPLLAFDNQGNRLGYGGGYYDHYIQQHRKFYVNNPTFFVGIAFSFQEFPGFFFKQDKDTYLPVIQTWDQRLDAVVIDNKTIFFCTSID